MEQKLTVLQCASARTGNMNNKKKQKIGDFNYVFSKKNQGFIPNVIQRFI